MGSACVIDSVVERKVVKYRVRAELDLIKVVIERPVAGIGPRNTAASWTPIYAAVARTHRLSVSWVGKDGIRRHKEGYGPKGNFQPREGHRFLSAPFGEDFDEKSDEKVGRHVPSAFLARKESRCFYILAGSLKYTVSCLTAEAL